MTLVLNAVLGQYYGVQGTTWQHPPILEQPDRDRRSSAASSCSCTSTGGKLTIVAWHTPQGVYWISNTLTDDLTNSADGRDRRVADRRRVRPGATTGQ